MGIRRLTMVATSDDEDESPCPSKQQKQQKPSASAENWSKQRKRKMVKFQEEDDKQEEEADKKKKRNPKDMEMVESKSTDGEEVHPYEDAKPIGDAVRISGKGRGRRKHYESFEFDGNQYVIEDPVLLVPEDKHQKPYVAIIKDISQSQNGSMMVTGQWFYRPEEAEREGGGNWQSHDTRDLFYSFHRDEVPAESVMHKCVVHFVPLHKQLPSRKQHPGFIVQKVYDFIGKKLIKLSDKDYEENKQQEIDDLVQKTLQRLGDLPDIVTEEARADQENQMKTKRSLRRRSILPLDVSKEEKATPSPKNDQHLQPETPGSSVDIDPENYCILANFKALTGDMRRDKWLERLLLSVQGICVSDDSIQRHDRERDNSDAVNNENNNRSSETANECQDKGQKSSKSFSWPDSAVPAIVALEKASHEALFSNSMKYNQKLRALVFNLKEDAEILEQYHYIYTSLKENFICSKAARDICKWKIELLKLKGSGCRNGASLARRLLNGELEPSKMINMSSEELKAGLTAEEIAKRQH